MNTATRYGLAIVATTVAISLRLWLTPFLGDRAPYLTIGVMLIFVARYLGMGPAIFTTLTSTLAIWFWVLQSTQERSDVFGMIAFMFFAGIIIAFGETTRRSKDQQDRSEQALRENEARLRLGMLDMRNEIERRTAELAQKTAQTMEQARQLDLANDAIFVRTTDNRISYWNLGAERLYGWAKEEVIGKLTHDILRTQFPVPLSTIKQMERWEGELVQVKRDGSEIIVASRWTALRDREGKFTGWLEINTDITARKRAEDAARRLSGRILSLQDDERRRIARELHDSLGQYLVSIKVNLDLLSGGIKDPRESGIISECLQSVEECIAETRTISHLLHPPLLDEAGFASAARWYIEGFSARSGLHVDFEIPPDLGRLNRDQETTLFRILQEALTNVHRHSGGSAARIALLTNAEHIQMQIVDNGKGIPEERLHRMKDDDSAFGVGLAGMRERVRDLGGSLAITSGPSGTSVTVSIPALRNAEPALKIRKSEDSTRGVSAA